MEKTKQQPLALRVCAEYMAGSFLLCFAIYAFSTWGSAVYGINIVFLPRWLPAWHMPQSPPSSSPACPVASSIRPSP